MRVVPGSCRRKNRSRTRSGSVALALTLVCGAASAAKTTPVVEQCFDVFEAIQVERTSGHFTAALALTESCRALRCPGEIANACVKWGRELRKDTPTVIFSARTPDGHDAFDLNVEIDGLLREGVLDGAPVPLDPGRHTVRFFREGYEETIPFVVTRGEQDRRVTLKVPPPEKSEEPSRFTRTPVLLSAGLGLAGLTFSGIAGVSALSIQSELEKCAPSCDPDRVAAAHAWLTAGDVGLVVAGVGISAALVFVLWPESEPEKPTASLGFGTSPGFSGLTLSGGF